MVMVMSMIKPEKLSMDLNDHVIDPGVLDTEPFPIAYKSTIRSSPDFQNLEVAGTKTLATSATSPHVSREDIEACKLVIFTSKMVESTSQDNIQANSSKNTEESKLPPLYSFFARS
jgi:hypothetical protein